MSTILKVWFPDDVTKPVISKGKSFGEKQKIASALEAIDHSKRTEYCEIATKLLDRVSYNATSLDEIVKEVAIINMQFNFSKDDWNEFIQKFGYPALQGLQDGKEIAMVCRAIATIPKEKWDWINKVIKTEMNMEDRFIVLSVLQSIHHEPNFGLLRGLRSSKDIARILIEQDKVKASSEYWRIRTLESVKVYEFSSVEERIEGMHREELSRWDCDLKDRVLGDKDKIAFKRVFDQITNGKDFSEVYGFTQAAKLLVDRYGKLEDQIAKLHALGRLPSDQRSKICDEWKLLKNEYMREEDQITLLNVIAALPADERKTICTQCRYMVKDHTSIQDKIALLNAIAALPSDEVEDICTRCRHLRIENRSVQDIIRLLNAIATVPSRNRNQILWLHSVQRVDELIERIRAVQNQPVAAQATAVASSSELNLEEVHAKFGRLGQIEIPEIALVIAAKGADSVYVVPEINDLIPLINRLVENPTKDSYHRFQFVRRAGGHSYFGEVIIDKTGPQPKIKMFVCDPLGRHQIQLMRIADRLSKKAIVEFFVPKSEEKLQKGLGCSYFSLDGAFMLREQEKYEDIYKVSDQPADITPKTHVVALPTRIKRGSQYYDAIKPIIESPQQAVVNKQGQTAAESIKSDLEESVNAEHQPRIFNKRIERKMRIYGAKVKSYLESSKITEKQQVDKVVQKHSLPGLQAYCESQVVRQN